MEKLVNIEGIDYIISDEGNSCEDCIIAKKGISDCPLMPYRGGVLLACVCLSHTYKMNYNNVHFKEVSCHVLEII